MIDFSAVKSIAVRGGKVARVLLGDRVLWRKGLPRDYIPLVYIEATGTQYINTGFTPNGDTRVVMDFVLTRADVANQIMGSRSSTSSRAFAFGASAGNIWRVGYANAYYDAGNSDTNRHTLDFNKNVVMLDDVIAKELTYQSFDGAHPIHIGQVKASSGMYAGFARIYACKIYDNDKLVRDYLPCLNNDGEAGLFDKVQNKFYGNVGGGVFEYEEGLLLKYSDAVLRENLNLTPNSHNGQTNSDYFTFKEIPIEPGATYYAPYGSRAWLLKSDKSALKTLNLWTASGTGSNVQFQFVAPENARYISVSYGYASAGSPDDVYIQKVT